MYTSDIGEQPIPIAKGKDLQSRYVNILLVKNINIVQGGWMVYENGSEVNP